MDWCRVPEAARYAAVGEKVIRHAVRSGALRVARLGEGRNYITCREWIDVWLSASSAAASNVKEKA
jgi:hypothetical protein